MRTNDLVPSFKEQAAFRCRAAESEDRAKAAGRMLKKIRLNALLTLEQLDTLLGVKIGTVAQWEKGHKPMTEAWSLVIIQKICAYVQDPKGPLTSED